MRSALVAGSRVEIVVGDITTQDVDAVVNAAVRSSRGKGDARRAKRSRPLAVGSAHALSSTRSAQDAVLARCWTRSLDVAQARGCRTVAFPAISTGAYGYPMDAAAKDALHAVGTWLQEHPGELDMVRVVLVKEHDVEAWSQHMGQLLPAQGP